MSQFDFGTIDPTTTSGTALATLLGLFRDARDGLNIGPAAPTYKRPSMLWMDNSGDPNWVLKIYDGANWVSLIGLNVTSGTASWLQSAARLGELTSSQFLRADVDTVITAALEARYGLHGGFGAGGSGGSGSVWGVPIWSLGKSYDGSGFGASFDLGAQFYGLTWLRADHPAAVPEAGEGLYIIRNSLVVAAFGNAGLYMPGLPGNEVLLFTDATDISLTGSSGGSVTGAEFLSIGQELVSGTVDLKFDDELLVRHVQIRLDGTAIPLARNVKFVCEIDGVLAGQRDLSDYPSQSPSEFVGAGEVEDVLNGRKSQTLFFRARDFITTEGVKNFRVLGAATQSEDRIVVRGTVLETQFEMKVIR